jgi:signal transduction histidine kinase/CheY-like chemotaxis protein
MLARTLNRLRLNPGSPGPKKLRLPLLALALGAAASLALFVFVKDRVEKEAMLSFERQASDAKHVMEMRVISYFNVLYGLAALFSKSSPLSRAEFLQYVEALDVPRRYPGIWGFSFAELVPHEAKARFEARVRRDTSVRPEGYPDFAIKPPGERSEYFVMSYVAPVRTGIEFAFGLDMFSNPRSSNLAAVKEAYRVARDSGKPTTSGAQINIGQGDAMALPMRLAVYRRGMPLETVAQRRAAYLGAVGAGFLVRELMQGVLDESTLRYLRFRLYDAGPASRYTGAARAQRPLFDSRDLAMPSDADPGNAFFETTLPMEFAGRTWEIHFNAPRSALIGGTDRALPWLALGGGLLISGLLFAIFYSLAAAAERVEVARREAVSANIAKTKFLAAASHDLRQPMQALSMYASVLEERVREAGALRVVRGIELSVRTLEQLFDSLLDISKIESGVVKPEVAAFALMPLIERVVEGEMPVAARKNLELRVARTSVSVRTDPALLERMLKNLVTNAIRYTERGGVVVGCRRRSGGRLRLEVVDSGIGIPAHEQERIFDEYYQIAGKSAQGLGLGLPIVKSLGELLGHRVAVRSALGRGSVFSIELESATGAVPAATLPGPLLHSTLKGITVVVVDDDAEIRNSVRLLLENWGCRGIGGATVAEVELELRAQGLTPDALVVDYRLADAMDGLQAIEHLRAAFGQHIPALIISGTASLPFIREHAARIPVAMKPVPPGKLRAFLSQSVRAGATPGIQAS